MKVALLTDGIYPFIMGGMQVHSYYLAKYLAKKKIQVDVYHYYYKNDTKYGDLQKKFYEDIDSKYVKLKLIKYPQKHSFPGHYLYERYNYSKNIYQQMISEYKYDFIYIQGFSGWYLLKNRMDKSVLNGLNFHGYEMFQRAPGLIAWLKMQMLKYAVIYNISRADTVFSFGGHISGILKKLRVEDSKIIEIPNAIEDKWLNYFLKPVQKVKRFVFVGRYERRKGIEELTEAIRNLNSTLPFEFHFVGPIPQDKMIKREGVIYHGLVMEQRNVKSIIKDCDVLVCPSYSEGMPNVILEAMSSGLAIIATDVGAVSKMVSAENGWLLHENNWQILKDTIEKAIRSDVAALEEMKRNSVQKIKNNFLWDDAIDQLIENVKHKHKITMSLV
jgi:glycosyltransferase involved in cell wall biosynthesis